MKLRTARSRAQSRAPSALALTVLASLALSAATPASAGELTEGIQDSLNDLEKQIEEARVWKFRLRPSFSQSVIWTDNVYLNDKGEQPFRLTAVTGPNGTIKNRNALRAIENGAVVKDFKDLQSEGRVQDTIFRTELSLGFVLPVNPEMTKLFEASEINVFTASAQAYNYVNENDLDNTGYQFTSDVFGFLDDLLSYSGGNKIWVRAKADYRNITEPLDTDIVQLQQVGILAVDFRDFERTEAKGDLDVGFREGKFDGFIGGSWFRMRLAEQELRQAEYDRYSVRAQVGWELPWFTKKHAYARSDFTWHRPEDRAVGGSTQALNDGNYYRIVGGLDGALGSEKLIGRAELGYASWEPNKRSGLSGDNSTFHAPVGLLEVAYLPWADARNTKLQLAYERLADTSAISNFNKIHRGTLSLSHEIVPGKWDGDVSFGVTRTDASEGPYNTLYDVGVGAVYHWFDQVDVSFRYLYRVSSSHSELKIDSSFSRGGRTYSFTSQSDGDFIQNSFQVALNVKF